MLKQARLPAAVRDRSPRSSPNSHERAAEIEPNVEVTVCHYKITHFNFGTLGP